MTAYKTIADDASLLQYLDSLTARGVTEIGLDFEGEFNLHVYGNHLCLIQVFDGRDLVIVDPFKVGTSALKAFLESPGLAKIMYDCASDGTLVADNYGIKLGPVIDLKPAVDVLEFPKRDLSTILGEVLGLQVIKKKKFQMYNWMRRPLDPEAVEYALGDVSQLYRLRDGLLDRLQAAGQLEAWREKNRRQQPDGIKHPKRPRLFKTREFAALTKAQQDRFTALFEKREILAHGFNLPPNSVVENAALFDLVLGRKTLSQLRFGSRLRSGDIQKILAGLSPVLSQV